jgi:hypothetical protein
LFLSCAIAQSGRAGAFCQNPESRKGGEGAPDHGVSSEDWLPPRDSNLSRSCGRERSGSPQAKS